ncbi:GPI mannosyltransferase 2-like isoform X1 [Vespula maculifrons]|uniref:GPI mannosyltransferase 2 n=1 Tax=Vespula maculifrons TaxID=7453 RepID=A0ABD2CDP3_VESMC
MVLKNTNIAYKAAILYCISPANIFFSAAYTESILTVEINSKDKISVIKLCNLVIKKRFIQIILTLFPFIILQIYNYVTFCKITLNAPILPTHIIDYATKNNLVLQYNATSTWCRAKIPIAYSYVQEKYWNVKFYSEHKMHFFSLGLIDIKYEKNTSEKKYPAEMFVFVIHGLFLTVFCICFVHIQVSTRLLCSASPLVYWYCALSLSYVPQFENDIQS